jgi:hypothetical protein
VGRKAFPKQTLRGVSINVRDVPKYLHLQMRLMALERNESLGKLYGEAVQAYLKSQDDSKSRLKRELYG